MFSQMDRFNAAIKNIRAQRYASEVNLAAGFRQFVRIVRQTEPYVVIVESLNTDLEYAEEVYEEKVAVLLRRMAIEDFNHAYANPNDEPMSVLVIALLDFGRDKKEIWDVVKDAECCYWLPMLLTVSLPSKT